MNDHRTKLLATLAGVFLSGAACAADAPGQESSKLTVEQVVQINNGLAQLNCANKVIKDGAKETQVCDNYKWSAGLTWQIASNQRKAQEVVTQYSKVRNQAIAQLPHKPDGSVTDDGAVQFANKDREWLDGKTDIALDHFKRSDLEPMNLPPSVISALLPIID